MDSNAKPLIVPAALHAPGAAQLSTSPSVQQAIGDLEDAKKAYGEAIDAAKTRLAAAYGAAILAATQRGDLDAAMALRRERDSLAANELNHGARDPDVKVEDGWTILFRSNDPLLFNAPVLNATSYSVAVSCAPPTTRWLRVKRMDTSQYVIVPMTAEGILKNGDTSEPFWWRGDKKLSACACNVGIVDQSMPTAGPTLQAMEPNGNFAGWGFGETVQGDRQGYVWARVTIPRTVFEIAVTDRDLSPEEEGQLLKAN
jgi:hypothetical protein